MKTWSNWIVRTRERLTRAKRGSVLMLTLLMVVGLTYIIATLLSSTVTEMKMNQRAQLSLEAKNAVESATEYVISVVRQKFDNNPNISGNFFLNNPITIPTTISGFLWNGTDVSPSNVSIKISLVPTPALVFVDPANPANAFDPDRGKNVTASDVYIYAQATAANGWGTQTAYGTQALEVRDTPLFTNAIFYNMDLEFHPGPNMTITGPVHCNGNIWAVGQNGLTFTSTITTSGNFNVGMLMWPTNWGGTSESAQTGKVVYIPNSAGGYTTPYIGGNLAQNVSSSYYDSRQTSYSNTTYTNWREMSANLWGGNLQSSANGVPNEQVTGYNSLVYQVNGSVGGQDLNYAYSIIQPAQTTNITNTTAFYSNGTAMANGSANPWNLQAGELDKFERNASIIVKVLAYGTANITQSVVVPTASVSSASMTANIDPLINSTVTSFQSTGCLTTSANQTISGTVQLSNGVVQSISGNWTNPYLTSNSHAVLLVTQNQQSSSAGTPALNSGSLMELPASNASLGNSTLGNTTGNTTRYVGFAVVEFQTVQTAVNTTSNTLQPVYNGSTTVTDSYGDVTYPGDVKIVPIQVSATELANSNLLWFQPGIGNMNTTTSGVGNTNGYTGNTSDIWNGLYDGRRGTTISTLNLDVKQLKNYVDNNVSGEATNATNLFNGSGSLAFNPANSYNGVVYVEFPEEPGNATRMNSVAGTGNTTYPGDYVLDSVGGNTALSNGNTSLQNTSTNTTGIPVGLVLYDAMSTSNSSVTGVPNPNYATTTEGTVGRVSGFTVGTNNALYTIGNFNADGNMNTPKSDTSGNTTYNSSMSDNATNIDPVVCLAADSVTSLSGSWNSRSGSEGTASPTEVNAAVLAGIVPSEKVSSTGESGGVQNFPRFLENWSGVVFRYRGSMVCMYESELANQPWGGTYYSPPSREWGFYNQFAKGFYPPGTPNARSYYRVNFSYLSKSVYTTDITGL